MASNKQVGRHFDCQSGCCLLMVILSNGLCFSHFEVNKVWFGPGLALSSDPAMADPVILTTYCLVPQDLKEIQCCQNSCLYHVINIFYHLLPDKWFKLQVLTCKQQQ